MSLKELFDPYLQFIIIFITLLINVYLIVKKTNFWLIIIGNILFMIIQKLLGLGEYNILIMFFEIIGELIGDLITKLFKPIADFFKDIFDIWPF